MLQSLRVVTPPAGLPVSLAMAKQHLRVDNDSDDALISMQIAVATELAESFLNRSLVTQTLSYSIGQTMPNNGPYVGGLSPVLPLTMSWPMLIGRGFDLPRAPVQSVVSLTTTAQNGVSSTLTPDQYSAGLNLEPARIRLGGYGYGAGFGLDVTTVVYTAGYATVTAGNVDTSTIPAAILQAVLMLTAFLYESRGDTTEGGEWPPVIGRLLWPHRLVTFGG